jgi:hypothetical protein
MHADELLARATHSARLPLASPMSKPVAGLLELAEKYEALAREMPADDDPPKAP